MEEYKRFGFTETATLAYYRANNEGLAAEDRPYVYLTYEDYLLGEHGRTYVLNVKAEAGE
jgi:ribosomal protein S18 acetylase RimI-like enzyme